jgi:hypothetical protein
VRQNLRVTRPFSNPHFFCCSRRVDFLTATDTQLQNLFEACDKDDVSDTSFGTLRPAHFSSNFNLERSGLLQALQPFLVDGDLEKQGIEAELCELNVYGAPLNPSEVYDF